MQLRKVILTVAALLAVGCTLTAAQPFQPGTGFLPKGNLQTVDFGGPYNLTLLSTQEQQVQGGLAARNNFTDADIIDFLVNVECLEGLFDTWGAFGVGFNDDLEEGGPVPIGAQKANLSAATLPFVQEIALSEQGHALFTRQAGSNIPCPLIDFTNGWNEFMAAAFQLPKGQTIAQKYGAPFNPWLNDANFITSMLTFEELGATGNKGLIGLLTNPALVQGVAGLATGATAFATVERKLLWDIRTAIVEPFGETVQQVFARISALRDSLDGPQIDDQGLINTDPRFIATPELYVNMIPTDIRGAPFARSPQQNINILTLGNPNGTGVFFPQGLNGRLNKPTGFASSASGVGAFPPGASNDITLVASQEPVDLVTPVQPVITGATPANVSGMLDLTQSLAGPLDNGTFLTRGFVNPIPPSGVPFITSVNNSATVVPVIPADVAIGG